MKRRKFSNRKIKEAIVTDAKPKRKNFSAILVGLILFIMIFSSVAIAFFNSSPATEDNSIIEYNGFKFRNDGSGWFLNINNREYGFEYPPVALENVKSADLKEESFSIGDYILFDPADFSDTDYEIGRLRDFFLARGAFVSVGCVKTENCNGLPVKSCDNTRAVLLRRGENTQIYKENKCIVLEAREGEEITVINRFMYGILGVM